MNLRCMYCQTMFGISREVMLIGLQTMQAENLTHYDVHCPKCRRANRVERKKLELANPNWQETVKAMAREAAKAEATAEKPATKSKAAPKKAASSVSAKKSAAKSTSAPKTSPGKKPAAKKITSKNKSK